MIEDKERAKRLNEVYRYLYANKGVVSQTLFASIAANDCEIPRKLGIVAQTLDVVRTNAQVRRRILARHPHLRHRLRLTYGQNRVFHNCINLTPSQYLIALRLDITFSWLYIQLG